MLVADPQVETSESAASKLEMAPSKSQAVVRSEKRIAPHYVPERGLVRRIRSAQANNGLDALAARHTFDPETQAQLSSELIKAGAPPITPAATEKAMARMVSFDPLNIDALRPFIFMAIDRDLRAQALACVGLAFQSAGRSVQFVSNAADTRTHDVLVDAGQKIGCGIAPFDGVPNCVDILRKADLTCLNLIETGFRAPLNKIAMLRLTTLIQATGSEPILIMKPQDADLAAKMSSIGVKRIVLAYDDEPFRLGPVMSVLRDANLSMAEFLDLRGTKARLRPAQAKELAALLTDTQPRG